MQALPIKFIREEDGPLVGTDLLNLARLAQHGFPVCEGLVITPPVLALRTTLERYRFAEREIFEQKLTLLRKELRKIPVPEELTAQLAKKRINSQKLWLHLLDFWLSEIRSRIWRQGFSPKLTADLTAQPIFFTSSIKASGSCYFDSECNLAVFEITSGELTDEQKEQLEELVKKANKLLFLPQLYEFIVEKNKGLEIVKLSPFTDYPAVDSVEQLLPQGFSEKAAEKKYRSTIKIFLQSESDFRLEPDLDGVIVSSEKQADYDLRLLQLVEYGLSLAGKPVIFKLYDAPHPSANIRGALQLIHRPDLLKNDVGALLFARNKKSLANIQLAIPYLRSSDEYARIKLELGGLKVTRKANLKFWLELGVPENLLNLESYLQVGFDGALLNLDSLSTLLGGFDPEGEEGIFYQKQTEALLKLIEPAFKTFHREKIPVVATGKLSLHDDVLSCLMKNGIWGLAVGFAECYSIHQRLRLIERRIIGGKAG